MTFEELREELAAEFSKNWWMEVGKVVSWEDMDKQYPDFANQFRKSAGVAIFMVVGACIDEVQGKLTAETSTNEESAAIHEVQRTLEKLRPSGILL